MAESVADLLDRLPEPLPDVEIGPLSEGRIGHLIGTSFLVFVVSSAVRALLDPVAPVQFVPVRLPRRHGSGYDSVVAIHQPSSPSSSWNVPVGPSLPIVAIRTMFRALISTGRPCSFLTPPSSVAV
jgi:hypothetical protein